MVFVISRLCMSIAAATNPRRRCAGWILAGPISTAAAAPNRVETTSTANAARYPSNRHSRPATIVSKPIGSMLIVQCPKGTKPRDCCLIQLDCPLRTELNPTATRDHEEASTESRVPRGTERSLSKLRYRSKCSSKVDLKVNDGNLHHSGTIFSICI